MSCVVMLLVCFCNVLSRTECTYLSTSKQLLEVSSNGSMVTENITYFDKINQGKDSYVFVDVTLKNNSDILNQTINYSELDTLQTIIQTINKENRTRVCNETSAENENSQINNFNYSAQTNNEFQTIVNKTNEHTNRTHYFFDESKINNTFLNEEPERNLTTDNSPQYVDETSLKINKRDVHEIMQDKVKIEANDLQTNNKKYKKEETLSNMTRDMRSMNESDFDKTLEYSEEDLSTGVHTLDNNDLNNNVGLQEFDSIKGVGSEVAAFIRMLQNLPGGKEKIMGLRPKSLDKLFLHDTGPQEFYLPPTCLIEWENCKAEEECCQPLHCSELPSYPTIGNLNESTTIEIKQFCSRFKSTAFKDLKTNRSDIIESYKKKMLEVLND